MSQALPAKNKLGYEHYVCYPDDGLRHEIIDGNHFVNPAPTLDHQRFSRRIQFQLYDQIEAEGRGEVFNASCDVQLTEHDIVQPDLIVVMNKHRLIMTPAKIEGVPDLIVEVLSPAAKKLDHGLKKELYERSGVPEYWIVDAAEHSV